METALIVVAVFMATLIATFFANIILRRKNHKTDENLEDRISRISTDALRQNSEAFVGYAKEILGAQKNEIRVDLEGKKTAIEKLVDQIRVELKENHDRLTRSDEERVRSFSALQNELKSYKEITGDLKISTDKLKDLLSNNQMRGAFGEQVADNLLKMAGFVIGQDYSRNETQATKDTRPDFTIFLPDQTKINIDVKFPYSALVKYAETEEKSQKEMYLREFRQAVKDKIKQVCSRDYINPEEKTVDFVIMFIPNEMIFSFIYDKMNDIWEDSLRKKVVLAGPFSFTAILRMVKQAYTNFGYQKNLQHIIGLIHKFDIEYVKFREELDRLGERINSTSKQFTLVSTTRDRQLTSVVEKIKSQSITDKEGVNLIE